MNDNSKFNQVYKRTAIIAAAFIIMTFAYAGVIELIMPKTSLPEFNNYFYSQIRNIMIIIMAVVVIGISFLKNLILAGKFKMKTKIRTGEPTPNDSIEYKSDDLLRRLYLSTIISYAAWDSIAVFGIVLYILGRNKTDFYTFVGAALILMIAYFPRKSSWESRMNFISESNEPSES